MPRHINTKEILFIIGNSMIGQHCVEQMAASLLPSLSTCNASRLMMEPVWRIPNSADEFRIQD